MGIVVGEGGQRQMEGRVKRIWNSTRIGRIEAQENPIGIVVANEFLQKQQTHLSLTGHIYSQFAVLFSSDVLDDLPEADRAIIRGGGAAAAKASRDFADAAAANGLERLKAAGMTIVTDVDKASFQKAVEGLKDQIKDIVNADALTQVKKMVA